MLLSGNTKASLNQGSQEWVRMSRRALKVKLELLKERKGLARKASSEEAGAEILLQNQGMETHFSQGEKVEDESSRQQVQAVTGAGQARVIKEGSGVKDLRC